MRIAVIGLGRMGANISRRLMLGGHQVVAFDRNPDSVNQLKAEGAIPAVSLEDAARTTSGQVSELVRYVEQSNPKLIDKLLTALLRITRRRQRC